MTLDDSAARALDDRTTRTPREVTSPVAGKRGGPPESVTEDFYAGLTGNGSQST